MRLTECNFTFLCLQKSCAGKETALVATQHENDHLKKEIEQLNGRNARLDLQLRQLEVQILYYLHCSQNCNVPAVLIFMYNITHLVCFLHLLPKLAIYCAHSLLSAFHL